MSEAAIFRGSTRKRSGRKGRGWIRIQENLSLCFPGPGSQGGTLGGKSYGAEGRGTVKGHSVSIQTLVLAKNLKSKTVTFVNHLHFSGIPLVTQTVKNLPAVWETWVPSLSWEDPLEKGMATHSCLLAWRIPWAEETGGLQSTGSPRVGQNWATNTFTLSHRKKPSSESWVALDCHVSFAWNRY